MIPILEVASQLVSEPVQCLLVALVLVVRHQQLRQLMASHEHQPLQKKNMFWLFLKP